MFDTPTGARVPLSQLAAVTVERGPNTIIAKTCNGILLIAHYRQLLAESEAFREAVVRGSLERLAPILRTALTAGLALVNPSQRDLVEGKSA